MRPVRTILSAAILATLAACSVPTSGTATSVLLSACSEEDGSTPGQSFPCRWEATTRGNSEGQSFTLSAPICSTFEISLADESHRRGYDIRLACDDAESVRSNGWTHGPARGMMAVHPVERRTS